MCVCVCHVCSVYLTFIINMFTCLTPLPCNNLLPAHSEQWPKQTQSHSVSLLNTNVTSGLYQEEKNIILPFQYPPAQIHKPLLW